MDHEHDESLREYIDGRDERIHQAIVQGFDNTKPVVYFGKIRTLGDKRVLVKITSAIGLKNRGSVKVFSFFRCDQHEAFEKFLRSHEEISPYRVKNSSKVFCMTEDDVERAVNVASRNAFQFREHTQRELEEMIFTNPTIRALHEKIVGR